MNKTLSASLRYLKGIGPKRAKLFHKAGLKTIEDLFYYFPFRYEDRTNFIDIAKLQKGQTYTIRGQVFLKNARTSFRGRVFSIIELTVKDNSGKISCVWFNQPYLKEYFKIGQRLILYGRVEEYSGRLQMNSPEFEIISDEGSESLSIGCIVPIYSLPEGITQRTLRQTIKQALEEYLPKIKDYLPYNLRAKQNLLNLARSIINIHFPENLELQKQAYKRLSFEEFFFFQLPLALRKATKKEKAGISHKIEGSLVESFVKSLPFKLTLAQEKVIAEIKQDMALPQAMQRLLQGDVGSGKTVVATIAAIIAVQGGYQAAFMAPTEILARQHYDKIQSQVKSFKSEVKIGLLTSSLNKKEKDCTYKEIREGKVDLIIGTHALLEENIEFKNLGLVIIDEQHKFGVSQRALLPKKGPNPDVLIMTATPIPRTLAITLYGDLDVSVIDALPPGRPPIKTVFFEESQKAKAYSLVKEQLQNKGQAYIIYPVIEESYALDIAGAKKMYEELKDGEFKNFRLGLIHGKLKHKEQDAIMQCFKEKKLDILIATTVLEVGIDIANATCVIIEHAQRFGLAQLHQLRGRVGRGTLESYCILIAHAQTDEAKARIEAMLKYSDGFHLAEEDLRIRGPGEFFGERQHGLTELKIANPLTQLQLLKLAREEAIKLINNDAHLNLKQHIQLKEKLLVRFPEYEKLILIG